MLNVLIILVGIAVTATVIYLAWHLWHEHIRARQEQKRHFRATLLARLRKKGLSALDFDGLVEECEVPIEIARETANTLYATYCQKALADGQITRREREQLESLQHALAVPTNIATAIETKARDERYRGAALDALADGKITADEAGDRNLSYRRPTDTGIHPGGLGPPAQIST